MLLCAGDVYVEQSKLRTSSVVNEMISQGKAFYYTAMYTNIVQAC
jgi:hypothetical protein